MAHGTWDLDGFKSTTDGSAYFHYLCSHQSEGTPEHDCPPSSDDILPPTQIISVAYDHGGCHQHKQAQRDQPLGARADTFPLFQRDAPQRSEEHTSELQSLRHLVCRLLLEKK